MEYNTSTELLRKLSLGPQKLFFGIVQLYTTDVKKTYQVLSAGESLKSQPRQPEPQKEPSRVCFKLGFHLITDDR